ncbi:alpha/beta fold hydrolase [Sphaerimonospora sp. CA-214678]|uniref:alpha/beta hydrolase n=1 Tax=Sphaerimonospora sp. CA-214678 TaxID=3240029 RepID=UPI003D8A6FB0
MRKAARAGLARVLTAGGAFALTAVLLAQGPTKADAGTAQAGDPTHGATPGPTPTATATHVRSATPAPSPGTTASPRATPSARATARALPVGTKVRTFSYGPHPRQRMDVWWNSTGPRRPAVFIIHGGWWSGGDKKSLTSISKSYVRLGYTVVNLNYRLSGDAPWPAQRTDALDVIETVRRHAALFNTDPDRYVVIGFSAGGHISTALGTYGDGLPGLRGVVGISPVVSPIASFEDGADPLADSARRKLHRAALILAGGCTPDRCPQKWSSMEVPFHASPGDAPVLTIHSDEEFVPPYQSELLREELTAAGVPMTIQTMPGTRHSSALYREPGVAETVRTWIASRLNR